MLKCLCDVQGCMCPLSSPEMLKQCCSAQHSSSLAAVALNLPAIDSSYTRTHNKRKCRLITCREHDKMQLQALYMYRYTPTRTLDHLTPKLKPQQTCSSNTLTWRVRRPQSKTFSPVQHRVSLCTGANLPPPQWAAPKHRNRKPTFVGVKPSQTDLCCYSILVHIHRGERKMKRDYLYKCSLFCVL